MLSALTGSQPEMTGYSRHGRGWIGLGAVALLAAVAAIAVLISSVVPHPREHALDPGYAKRLGVNLDQLLVSQPDSGEQALEIVELLVASSAVDIIVVDSVAALVPKAELEGNMGDSFIFSTTPSGGDLIGVTSATLPLQTLGGSESGRAR